jgi:hypothetical protein
MYKNKFLSIAFVFSILAPVATFAQATSTTATSTSATSTQITCMQNAVEKRETSLITAHDTYAAAVKTALTNRMNALKLVWAQVDKQSRMSKREQAYKAFRTEMQTANSVLRTTKNTSWKNFQTDAKACGVKGTGETPSIISTANISL